MQPKPQNIQRTFLILTLLNTLAASFIWGINTLFLLDAGLSNLEAFAANAAFTVGQVIFEVPTGIIADTYGRRTSYLLGAFTLGVSTLLYFWAWQVHSPFWIWAVTSALLGLGFTFFSGATEAWLVDALKFTNFKGSLESVFAKAQSVGGVAMLTGSVAGGFIAQATNLGVPYILRTAVLGLTFIVAFVLMKDLGFKPIRSKNPLKDIQNTFKVSINVGFKNPPVRWIMISALFTSGVSFYAFYAMQPFLLELYGDRSAYTVAGLAAAIIAGAQIFGGVAANYIRKAFDRRTTLIGYGILIGSILLFALGFTKSFWIAIGLLVLWGLIFSAIRPARQAYLNDLIDSKQRATVLSFDNLLGSSGGVVIQPILGKAADVWSYSVSYVIGAVIQVIALPFILLAKKQNSKADKTS